MRGHFAHVAALDQPRAAVAADIAEDMGPPCLSRVSSNGMPKPSWATAMFGSGSSAEGAITCGSRSNSFAFSAAKRAGSV